MMMLEVHGGRSGPFLGVFIRGIHPSLPLQVIALDKWGVDAGWEDRVENSSPFHEVDHDMSLHGSQQVVNPARFPRWCEPCTVPHRLLAYRVNSLRRNCPPSRTTIGAKA